MAVFDKYKKGMVQIMLFLLPALLCLLARDERKHRYPPDALQDCRDHAAELFSSAIRPFEFSSFSS
jgi:hypothetical protein